MRTITITIPDGYEQRVLDCFALRFSWEHPDGYAFDGYLDEKEEFLKDRLIEYIDHAVKYQEVQDAVAAAQANTASLETQLRDSRKAEVDAGDIGACDPVPLE